jgi:hypothetical protein
METGVGDRLARGWPSATFGPAKDVSQEQWNKAFEGWSLEEFMKGDKKDESGTGKKEQTHI